MLAKVHVAFHRATWNNQVWISLCVECRYVVIPIVSSANLFPAFIRLRLLTFLFPFFLVSNFYSILSEKNRLIRLLLLLVKRQTGGCISCEQLTIHGESCVAYMGTLSILLLLCKTLIDSDLSMGAYLIACGSFTVLSLFALINLL